MPLVDCVVKFLPPEKIVKKEISFPPLYNLKYDMLENKKKLAKLLPPVPSWSKTKPPPVEVKKETPKNPEKIPTKQSPPKEDPKNFQKEISLKEKKTQKKIIEESLEEESEEEEEEESSGSEEEEEEDESGEESDSSDSEKEDSGSESEESSKESRKGNSLEESSSQEEEEQEEPAKNVEELSKEEKLKNGYTENLSPEEIEKRDKEALLKKYKLLQYRLQQKYQKAPDQRLKAKIDGMITLGPQDTLEIIKETYDKEIFELKVISNTQRYKQLLLMGFAGVEAVGTQFMPSLEGYTKFHLANSDEYEDILMEIGGESNGFIENMSPFSKLMWSISVNTFAFIAAKNMGPNASDFMAIMTGRKAEPVAAPKIHLD